VVFAPYLRCRIASPGVLDIKRALECVALAGARAAMASPWLKVFFWPWWRLKLILEYIYTHTAECLVRGWTTLIKVIKYFISRRQQLTSALSRSLPAAAAAAPLYVYAKAPRASARSISPLHTAPSLYNYINIHPRIAAWTARTAGLFSNVCTPNRSWITLK
jgi:hypothetical protein